MKKLLILIAFCYVTIAQAQNTRNDSYSAFGILTVLKKYLSVSAFIMLL